ncbi:hypothetical protein VSWAT3_20460 [Vibrionales bacterium SWAT-3]|nr:hypothetical protein VSWAT3_20460 [Vibrionales bacterium SWAT-3]
MGNATYHLTEIAIRASEDGQKTTGNAMHSDAFQCKGMSDLRLFTGGKLTIVGDVVLV